METALLYVAGAVLLGLAGVGVGVGVGVLGHDSWKVSPASQNFYRCLGHSFLLSWVWWMLSPLSALLLRSTSCSLSWAVNTSTLSDGNRL